MASPCGRPDCCLEPNQASAPATGTSLVYGYCLPLLAALTAASAAVALGAGDVLVAATTLAGLIAGARGAGALAPRIQPAAVEESAVGPTVPFPGFDNSSCKERQ